VGGEKSREEKVEQDTMFVDEKGQAHAATQGNSNPLMKRTWALPKGITRTLGESNAQEGGQYKRETLRTETGERGKGEQ